MEPDRIRMEAEANSDISDTYLSICFQFPSSMMEADQICMEMDSHISDIHFLVYFRFPWLSAMEYCCCFFVKRPAKASDFFFFERSEFWIREIHFV